MNRPLVSLAALVSSVAVLTGCAGTPPHYAAIPASTLYAHARSALMAANYRVAEGEFRALKADHPFSHYAREAALYLIYTHFMAGQDHQAADAAHRFIRANPRSAEVPYAYFMIGVAQSRNQLGFFDRLFAVNPDRRRVGHYRVAFDAFKKLLTRFPTSPYAVYARGEMIRIRNLIANHELYVARYYLDKRAYVASANRAAAIVQEMPQTIAARKALGILVRDYRHLDEPVLAKQAQALLERNSGPSSSHRDGSG
ncbi:DNA uptake lipoprotein [mine drainage metagenome]|uniref:DNA uptake lipoprotein n=1 Tax=mine drainage metagenome TaxID=410659 RepID=T1BSM5_9ZZZZ